MLIAVTATGGGIAKEIEGRVFEPFFTIKPPGRGTGLGLAQVYGFLKQSGGHAKLYNEPGHGVTVKLYLPRYLGDTEIAQPNLPPAVMPLAKSAELILVVEDDPSMLDMTTRMLGELGYRTLTAARPDAALEMLARTPEIELLLTDVVMPIMNGRELAEAAASIRLGIKVLFATGYTQNAIVHNGIVDAGVELIVKPFSLETLAVRVDRVLRAMGRRLRGSLALVKCGFQSVRR